MNWTSRCKLFLLSIIKVWPQYVGTAAQIVSAVVAVIAAIAIYKQVELITINSKITQINAQIANARQVYMSYSDASLKYPELTEPDYPSIKANRIELLRYKAFVAQMLFAYDDILNITTESEWMASFRYEIAPHMAFICEDHPPAFTAQYSRKMQGLLSELRQDRCGK